MTALRSPFTVGSLLATACAIACATTPRAPESQPTEPPPPVAREDASLVPRALFFGNPERTWPQLSPDGNQIAFLAPWEGVLNVWVGPADDWNQAKPVTADKTRNIRQYSWSYSGSQIVYLQDQGGDEDWHLFAVDLPGGAARDLTPMKGIAARPLHASPKHPDQMLVGINDRDAKAHDVYRVNLRTGGRVLVFKNDRDYASFVADDDLRVRLAGRMREDGSMEWVEVSGNARKPFLTIPYEDTMTTSPLALDAAGKTLYLLDSRGRNTAALFALDWATRKTTLLAEDPRADVQEVLAHPRTHAIQAAASMYERVEWQVIDPAIAKDLDYLRTIAPGDLNVVDRTLDDDRWIALFDSPEAPQRFYLYDRSAKTARFLFSAYPALENVALSKMHSAVIPARDGLKLVSYYTLPRASDPDGDGRPDQPLPTILLVHGGPWYRDQWGYHPYHQWLASRGYAVLSVNFRGSTGFGKAFVNAGDLQWGARMHDDLVDAVRWAQEQRIADPKRTAIMGGSYGGYATLVGLTFTPDIFACGVDIVGPSNLQTLSETIPPYWAPVVEMFAKRMGDARTEEGRALLRERSPLYRVEQIRRPLLIGQGANDPRVKKSESEQIVKAMQEKGIPVTYVVFPDEGHGFAQPENRTAFHAVAESFLAHCLGGPYQPIGEDFKGSSITIPVGAELVPGVQPRAAPQ